LNEQIRFPVVEEPRVSVLIVTYGGWDFVSIALRSLLENTEPCYEVIIVDNASPDLTASRLKKHVTNARLVFNEENVGFGPAGNQAASLARAPYLAFLNSDCFVRPGWLPPLVQALEDDARLAAAAPVVLNPDGSLQEAGCLLFGNGHTQLLGDGDDAGRPEYRFRRIVDYASAACLVLRRRAFLDAGGFDAIFAPAYFEDVDVCLRLRNTGLATLFEPRSAVTHVRGASGGGESALAIWQKNLIPFRERWKDVIALRPMPGDEVSGPRQALSARDAVSDARLLIVGNCASSPGPEAGVRSVLPLLATLAAGWPECRITVLTPTLPTQVLIEDLARNGIEVVAGLSDPAAWLDGRRSHYDAVLLGGSGSGSPLDLALRETQPAAVWIEEASGLDEAALAEALSRARIPPPRQPRRASELSSASSRPQRQAGDASQPSRPVAIVVLGMHRSGTSALTGCLRFLGVPLGRPLMPSNAANEKGFFEHMEVVAIHDELLMRLGAGPLDVSCLPEGWETSESAKAAALRLRNLLRRNFEGVPVWAVKDPRLCVLLPLWLPLLEELEVEPRFLLMLRSPWEIARSLEKRDRLGLIESLDLWLRHLAAAESATRKSRRAVLTYDRLLSDPGTELSHLGEVLGLTWLWSPAAVRREIHDFLAPSLRHFGRSDRTSGAPKNLVARVNEFDTALEALARSDDAAARSLVDERRAACEKSLEPLFAIGSEDPVAIRWQSIDVPATLGRGERRSCRAAFSNKGGSPLSKRLLSVACHWLDAADRSRVVIWDDGLRTPVPRILLPGETWSGEFTLQAPSEPGRYLLQVDLVREGVAWFSAKGVAPLTQPVTIA
jgi:GT2 family glycosyltransferase